MVFIIHPLFTYFLLRQFSQDGLTPLHLILVAVHESQDLRKVLAGRETPLGKPGVASVGLSGDSLIVVLVLAVVLIVGIGSISVFAGDLLPLLGESSTLLRFLESSSEFELIWF